MEREVTHIRGAETVFYCNLPKDHTWHHMADTPCGSTYRWPKEGKESSV